MRLCSSGEINEGPGGSKGGKPVQFFHLPWFRGRIRDVCVKSVFAFVYQKASSMSSQPAKPASSEDIVSQKVCGPPVFVCTRF